MSTADDAHFWLTLAARERTITNNASVLGPSAVLRADRVSRRCHMALVSAIFARSYRLRDFDPKALRGFLRASSPMPAGGPRRTTIFAFGPDSNERVLGHPEVFRTGGQGIPGPRGSMQSQLRQGLTRMKEPKHRLQRQVVMPTMLKASVDRYLPIMNRIIDEELAGWRPGVVVNMDTEMRRIMTRVAGETLFGEPDRERSLNFGLMVSEWLRRNYKWSI